MKKIDKNNLKLQMINSAGNHVFEITNSRKEKIEPMKKNNHGRKQIKKSVSNYRW